MPRAALRCVRRANLSSYIELAVAQAYYQVLEACALCRVQVAAGIYKADFARNFYMILLPAAVLLAAGIVIFYASIVLDKIKEETDTWL